MRTDAETGATKVKFNGNDSLTLPGENTPGSQFLDKGLFLVKTIVEYAFGIYLGLVVGRLLGWYVGGVFAEYFGPVYFSDLNELRRWQAVPQESAANGIAVGILVGATAVRIINKRLLRCRIACLCQNEVTAPREIAMILGRSTRPIEREVRGLADEGTRTCRATDSKGRNRTCMGSIGASFARLSTTGKLERALQ